MKKIVLIFCLIVISTELFPCTSAVISAKASADGRPILWKHRDTGEAENKLVRVRGEKYDFTGLCNVSDSLNSNVWMGSNDAGFSIMNTASYNIAADVAWNRPKDLEGVFMRRALEICATIDDFETFLDTTSGKRGVEANFGVIDAAGGAAYYETGFYRYVKYDVNDPADAPAGFLIRTNFSFAGDDKNGQGYVRYTETMDLFNRQILKGGLDVEFILKKATRNMHHGLMKRDIWEYYLPANRLDEYLVPLQDYIVRYWSASSMIIQGVLPDEDPGNTVLWTLISFPLTSLVTPVWAGSGQLPECVRSVDGSVPDAAKYALTLKDLCFPYSRGNGNYYMNTAPLKNREGNGTLEKLVPKEDELFRQAERLQNEFRKNGLSEKKLRGFYRNTDIFIKKSYIDYFKTIGLTYE